ncbi:hypothetical protein [Pseudomonas gingeri]|uniref:Uncharacterized protein n=1 Tax=Pseudomonas gingeri TaxID=117681 RepID=A0A7Y7YKP3_9PSED|nr:hypothetical protein [Pseudomonas gingeri]NWB30715.1 hypothetical protein [Pseudomonas gingeri]NWC36960.1 hypothetical protein [Pseudomonas gingeri]
MSKTSAISEKPSESEALAVPGLIPLADGFPGTAEAVSPIGPARVFRDKLFTSRTLVMPDGLTLPVAQGRVYACGDDQYAFLKAHPDLEPLE